MPIVGKNMIFKNRSEAGKLLAESLKNYKSDENAIVIGLARGGVVIAAAVAHDLHLPLDVICPRKLGAPINPEFAIGAITESGEGVINEETVAELGISPTYIDQIIQRETRNAQERIRKYRAGRPQLALEGKTVILVDDGLATGATMKAAIKSVQEAGAEKVVVAVPVAPPDTVNDIEALVDEVVCLHAPAGFAAVGQFYEDFSQTEDDEVIELLMPK